MSNQGGINKSTAIFAGAASGLERGIDMALKYQHNKATPDLQAIVPGGSVQTCWVMLL